MSDVIGRYRAIEGAAATASTRDLRALKGSLSCQNKFNRIGDTVQVNMTADEINKLSQAKEQK